MTQTTYFPKTRNSDSVIRSRGNETRSVPFGLLPDSVEVTADDDSLKIRFHYAVSESPTSWKNNFSGDIHYSIGKYTGKLLEINIDLDELEEHYLIKSKLLKDLERLAGEATPISLKKCYEIIIKFFESIFDQMITEVFKAL